MHYKEFATRMREQMPNTLSNMDDRAIADLAIKRKPQYASMISFDEPVVEQPQQANTQPVSSGNPLLDIWNDPNKSVQDFLNANNAEMEYQKKLSDPNYIAQEDAKRRLAELDQWKKEHPVLSVADDLANITSPFQAEWELRAKYGNNAPLEEVLKTKGKQAFLGGTGVASTAIPAGAFVKTAKIASIANKASKAKKLNDAFKSGKYGAAFVGVPSASENIEKVIDGEQNLGDALANTAKDTVLGAAGGALGYGLSGLTTKGILNKVEADVANKYFSKAIKGGNQLSDPRKLETLQKQAVKKLMDSHKGAAIKTADGLVAGLGDAAVIGSADYGLNKLQGKQQEPYIDHMKPYMGFGLGAGLLPGAFHYLGKPVEKALKSDVIKGAISKNEFMSNLVGEGANAFGVKTDIPRAKQYQELGEKVKDYDMPAAKHYTSKEMAEADSAKNLSPKERRIYLNYLKNGFTKEEAMAKATSQSNSKFDEMHAKAEQEQKQDFTENIFGTKQEERPTVKNQLVPVDTSKKQIVPVNNVDTSVQKPKEHVAEPTNPVKEQGDINTPTDTQTHVNEPASHVKTKKIIPNKVIDNDTSNYKVIKLEPGQAEGADTPYKSNNKMTKQGYENNLWKEEPASTTEYVTDDAEFIKWYQQYKNSSDEQKDVLLAQKLKTFKNNEEQYDFYKKFNEQEERNLELARKKYKSEESHNNVINKKTMIQRKPHTDQPDELGRYVKVVKENNIDITPKKEIEISEKDMQKADALLRGILPANMKRKGWSNDEILDRLFKTYSHSEKGAQSVYDRLAKKLQLIKGDTNLKTALYKKLNDAAERYMKKTGKKITHKTKGLNANSSRANAVLSKIEEALEKGDLDIARNYIDNNKKLLKSTGNFKGNATIDKAYTAFTNKGIKDVNSLLNNGDFQKAEELWTRIKPLVKTTYTDHSIKKMYKNLEGKKVDIGDTYTEGSAVNPSAEFERIEKEIENKINSFKNKKVVSINQKTPKNLLKRIKNICDANSQIDDYVDNSVLNLNDLSSINKFKKCQKILKNEDVIVKFNKPNKYSLPMSYEEENGKHIIKICDTKKIEEGLDDFVSFLERGNNKKLSLDIRLNKIQYKIDNFLEKIKKITDNNEYKRLEKELEKEKILTKSFSKKSIRFIDFLLTNERFSSFVSYVNHTYDDIHSVLNAFDKDVEIVFLDGRLFDKPTTVAFASNGSKTIFVFERLIENQTDLYKTLAHEYRHILDFENIYSNKDKADIYKELTKIHSNAVNSYYKELTYFERYLNYFRKKTNDAEILNNLFLKPYPDLAEDFLGNFDNNVHTRVKNKPTVEEYINTLKKYFEEDIIEETDAARLGKIYLDNEIYCQDILEVRANEHALNELSLNELKENLEKIKGLRNNSIRKIKEVFKNANIDTLESSEDNGWREFRKIARNKRRKEEGNDASYRSEQRTGDRIFGKNNKSFSFKHRERIKDLHKTSIDIEQKRIKRGLITPEQAENRKKQLKSKYYIPMKTGNAPIEDTLDLTRNYNEGRETKVGLYGKGGKWKEHITPEKAVENLHIASVKTNFVDEIADYVEKNFAKPLNKNGTHDEDWVAVNAHLLWNGLAAKQSRSWYNLIDSGEDAIRKAFKNKEQADAFVELHNRTRNKDFQIPKQVFKKLLSGEGETAKEAFERYGLFNRHSIGKHVAALTDAFTDQFKRTVLGTSSFWVNNRFSNHLLLAANSENPARHIIDLYMAGKIKAKDMPQELLENSILEAVSQSTKRKTFSGYNTFDNIVNLFGGHAIDTKTLKGIKKATASVANVVIGYPNKVYNTIAEKLLNFNSKFENYERKVALLQQLRANEKDLVRKTGQQMLTVEEALKYLDKHPEMRSTIVKQVENVLGDYNNFTATEKQIIKRLIPFYSWFRTVARNTVHLAKKNPARFALIQYELHKLKEEDKDLKEWQRGAFRLPVKDKRSGKQLLVNKVNQVPWETLKQFGNETDIKNSINPLVKVPIEGISGKKFFGSGEITNKRYVSTFAGKNADGSNRYKYFDTKTKKEIDKLPVSTRAAYVSKELGKNFAPLLSNRLIGGESLLQGYDNYKKTGKFLEPDKLYDADLGGFHHGDIAGSKLKKSGGYKTFKRFATNNTAEEIKLLNRLGLTLQPKQDLSQADIAKLKRATEKYKKKRKAS